VISCLSCFGLPLKNIILTVLDFLKKNWLIKEGESWKLIVQESWRCYIHIVLDICNDDYNLKFSHFLEYNDLPLLIDRLIKKD
jgi:hypothetical protein